MGFEIRRNIFDIQIIVDLSDDAATTTKRHSRNEEDGIGFDLLSSKKSRG